MHHSRKKSGKWEDWNHLAAMQQQKTHTATVLSQSWCLINSFSHVASLHISLLFSPPSPLSSSSAVPYRGASAVHAWRLRSPASYALCNKYFVIIPINLQIHVEVKLSLVHVVLVSKCESLPWFDVIDGLNEKHREKLKVITVSGANLDFFSVQDWENIH